MTAKLSIYPFYEGVKEVGQEGTDLSLLGFSRQDLKLVLQFKDTWAIGNVCFKCMC